MARKPTVQEIKGYIDRKGIMGLQGARVKTIYEGNHLMYRVEAPGQKRWPYYGIYALRMINPESYRAREWMSMAEEYQLLKALEDTGIGPKVYAFDEGFSTPFLIQEFVRGTRFNDLKPLSQEPSKWELRAANISRTHIFFHLSDLKKPPPLYQEHLIRAARSIAILNSYEVDLKAFPFLRKYTVRSYERSGMRWLYQLGYSCLHSGDKDPAGVLKWVVRILPLALRAQRIISRFAPPSSKFALHLDSVDCRNTYWRDGRAIFLDWEKVSYRDDDSFTLVRFAISIGENGEVSQYMFNMLIREYLRVRSSPDLEQSSPHFGQRARIRLLERLVSDLVGVVWNYTRPKSPKLQDLRPVEQATNVIARFNRVKQLLYLHAINKRFFSSFSEL